MRGATILRSSLDYIITQSVGRRSIHRMRWIMAFANMDVSTLDEDETRQIATELHVFAFLSGLDWTPGKNVSKSQILAVGATMLRRVYEGKEPGRASQREVGEAHHWIRDILAHLMVPDASVVKLEVGIKVLIETDRDAKTGRVRTFNVRQSATNLFDQFRLGVARLLAQFASAVIVCRECRKFALARRVDQVFCSRACLSRATTRRHREKHGAGSNARKRRTQKIRRPKKGV
jgi:hypothetical protein